MLRYTAWAEVDLNAIAHNYREIRRRIGKKTKLCAVIKADAYGHGAVAVARIALDEGADYLAVATLSEALKLRAAGFTTPLLILGLIGAESASEIVTIISRRRFVRWISLRLCRRKRYGRARR